jgi:outer membrane protein assembly factor BamB
LVFITTAAQQFGKGQNPAPQGPGAKPQEVTADAVSGVYLPTDRSLSRAITRARERIAAHEYHEALTFLQGILSRDEDAFLEKLDGDQEQIGLKVAARRMIADLPPEGGDAYELLHGATARRQLEAALRTGDQNAIAKVVRQFSHTRAGDDAALVLAQIEADQGRRLAAAQIYQTLIDSPQAAARFEPQLSVAAALNHAAAGNADLATATLRSIARRMPSVEVTLSGKPMSLPAPTADLMAWLSGLVDKSSHTKQIAANWLTVRGDPSRNLQISGGGPHLRTRWQARVVNEPTTETYLTGRMNDFVQRGVVAIPSAKAIAVGDTIVMRTPENVVAVDWPTGKRIWETRDEDELQSDEAQIEVAEGVDPDQLVSPSRSIDGRMWDDALLASISSDGKRVFVLRGVSVARDEEEMIAWRIVPGLRRGFGDAAEATNQLAAYDLATQGKLAWELDGDRAAGPLAGAFFLGAPLAVDGTLYVMAEIHSSIFLLAIEPESGQVQWQQRLVELEQGIGRDFSRRQLAASLSFSEGLLICPTAASAVVALDIVKREFAWVYRYPREGQSPNEVRGIWQQPPQPQSARVNDRWLDGSAVIADGRIFITPPESSELHCLDLKSGKLFWKQRRGNLLFIGGVDQDRALMVGAGAVQALRVSDGTSAWNPDVVLPSGVLPAGQGYLSEGIYYLPLTSGEVAAIEVATGQLSTLASGQSELILGNLLGHRGSIISQSPLVLEKFEQLSVLKQRTEAALAANPDDAQALRDMAELKRADGNMLEAIELLKTSNQLAPDDPVTQQMLVELLLTALADDYASHRDDVPLVAKLLRDRDQQIELLRIDAAGLEQIGERTRAADAYLRLADFTAEEPVSLQIQPSYAVRSDRWISGRLFRIWLEASADERQVIADKVTERRPALTDPQTAASLRHFLAHFGQLPGATDVRLALARYLIDRSRGSEAELELLQLLASSDGKSQAAAARLMASLAAKANQQNDKGTSSAPWPRGQVDVALLPATASPRDPNARAQAERQSGFRSLRIEQDLRPAAAATQWFISNDCTELAGRNAAGYDVFRITVDQNESARQIRDSSLVHGARMGRFLYLALTGQLVAIDTSKNPSSLDEGALWQASSFGSNGNDSSALNSNMEFPLGRMGLRGRRAAANSQARITRRPVYNAASDRKRIAGAAGASLGSLGPVSPGGVVYQQRDVLKCVDPLSGEVLWVRTDLPPACELFGDEEFVFVADVSENVAHVVRVVDGEIVGKRPLDSSEWLLTAGRNVAQLGNNTTGGNRVVNIRITDAWSQKALYDSEYTLGARFSVVEPGALAILEPSGKFQLVDVRTGQLTIDEQLSAVSDLQSIYAMPSGDDLLLAVSGPVQQKQVVSINQADCPLINGPLYAFSLKTGQPLWPGPAIIRNRGLVLSQPPDSPMLVFADRKMTRDAETGGSSQLRLLCLDKRTGQTVYRESLPENMATRLRIRAERQENPAVVLELGSGKIQLTMTDRPRSPQPPSNDDLEAPRETVERGLRGLGRRVGGALRGALQSGGDVGKPRVQLNPPNQNRPQKLVPANKPPQGEAKQETDDD